MIPSPSFPRVIGQHEPIFTGQSSVHSFLPTQTQTATVSSYFSLWLPLLTVVKDAVWCGNVENLSSVNTDWPKPAVG